MPRFAMPAWVRRSAALVVVACLAASFAGCKPKAGAACKPEAREFCSADKQALACHDGKWEEMSCRGPAGCARVGSDGVCDQSVVEEKDVCNIVNDFVCATDKKSMLVCAKNRWTFSQACLGERGCSLEQPKRVSCDNSVANVGDVCHDEDDYACSPDKKSALVCRSSKFVLANDCRGKNGCRVVGDKAAGFKVQCDDSFANIGDVCNRESAYACTPDEKQIVKCTAQRFVGEEKCKKNEKCGIRGELVGCY
jgi:hypothetical protein